MEENLTATIEENLTATMEENLTVTVRKNLTKEKKWWKKSIEKMVNWMTIKNKDEWVTHTRGNLSLAATIISTITFQNSINPLGGVRPAVESRYVKCPKKLNGNSCPGQSVLAIIYPNEYVIFLISNTICLVSSLTVCLLLVSDFPLNNRFFTWLLSLVMCITLTTLTSTYMIDISMITPYPIWHTTKTMFNNVIYIWFGLHS